jgi:hypothetical protein
MPLLTDETGTSVPYIASWEAVEVPAQNVEYVLPPNGIVGRIIDLACAVPDFGFDTGTCLPVYTWRPGRYRLQMDYVRLWTCFREPCVGSNVIDLDLLSEPIDVIVEP